MPPDDEAWSPMMAPAPFGAGAMLAIGLFVALMACPDGALAKARRRGDQPDPVAIAAVLLENDNPTKALEVLSGVDEQDEALDRVRFYTLRGIAALQAEEPALAASSLERALAARRELAGEVPEDEVARGERQLLELYLAYARFALDDCSRALAALDRAGRVAEARPRSFALRGECERREGRFGPALDALRAGQERFSGDAVLKERELLLLAELGLYQELSARAQAFLDLAEEDDALLLLEAVRRREDPRAAAELGERVRLHHASSTRAALALAHAYVAADLPLAAARLFEQVSLEDPAFAAEAAELYRRAGWTEMARLVGARSPDATKKLRQRFGMLLDKARFEEAASLAPRLWRRGLLDDDELRYALAFAQFKTRRFEEAEQNLKAVQGAALFRQATELRRAIASCREEGWECR